MEFPKTRTKGIVANAMYSHMEPLLDLSLDLLFDLLFDVLFEPLLAWSLNLFLVLVLDVATLFTLIIPFRAIGRLTFPVIGESILC
ncbi:hypothetical protein PAENIP36_19910 [Paenibacillus sp. P36]